MNEMFRTKDVHKTYWAIVANRPTVDAGELSHWLVRNEKQNKSYAYEQEKPNSKKAVLGYKVIGKSDRYYLLEVDLKTGRHHQIRVQFSSRGFPLVGERKYSILEDGCPIALWSYRLSFSHPITGEQMEFTMEPPVVYPWTVV